jgi:hypothetical protein
VNDKSSTAVGYSPDIDNMTARPQRVKAGRHFLVNLLYSPVPNAMVGGEYQWDDARTSPTASTATDQVQFSFKYNFVELGG